MKKLALIFCGALAVTTFTALAGGMDSEIEVGDARAFVIEILGEPNGGIDGGAYELLQFDRGNVEFADGKVMTLDLVSEQEAAARKYALIRAEEARRKGAEARAKEETLRAEMPTAAKPAPAASKPEAPEGELTPEQQAELDQRIAEGIDQPPIRMSKRKLRRYRRGRSPSQLASRKTQITEAFMAELKATEGK